jgi:hypothetical protein
VLFTDRGHRYTLLAALFFAPSVITIKQAILASSAAMGTEERHGCRRGAPNAGGCGGHIGAPTSNSWPFRGRPLVV